ncbi:hypothetical protein CK203_074647 [Vitis vinifera]|uniref:Uncharacterized protein n=1 Tax=Vitis vinifera TaxID=29760 RepID=A0A438DWB9_VITVI|nr:hypothetical protein CK203_074647 [Vitis vinifera]
MRTPAFNDLTENMIADNTSKWAPTDGKIQQQQHVAASPNRTPFGSFCMPIFIVWLSVYVFKTSSKGQVCYPGDLMAGNGLKAYQTLLTFQRHKHGASTVYSAMAFFVQNESWGSQTVHDQSTALSLVMHVHCSVS